MFAAIQFLISLDDLVGLQLKLELLEAHLVVAAGVSGALVLITLQHLLLEPFIHLLHELFAALASLMGLIDNEGAAVGHGGPRRARGAVVSLKLQRVFLAAGLLVAAKATVSRCAQLILLMARRAALLQFDLDGFVGAFEAES